MTTVSGASRLGPNARAARLGHDPAGGTGPADDHRGRDTLPARPKGSQPIVGDVVGFALTWEGQQHGALWISGDTVLFGGVRGVRDAHRRRHCRGAPRAVFASRSPGPVKYSMNVADAVDLCGLVKPHTVVPVHYEGWSHFAQGRRPVEDQLAQAEGIVRWRRCGGCRSASPWSCPSRQTDPRASGGEHRVRPADRSRDDELGVHAGGEVGWAAVDLGRLAGVVSRASR